MTRARLFDYRNSQLYYKRYGIDPDRHFDKLCGKYGTDVAVDIVDRNMMKIWESRKKEAEKQNRFERCSDAECPFST